MKATAAAAGAYTPILSIGYVGGGKEIRVGQNVYSSGFGAVFPCPSASCNAVSGFVYNGGTPNDGYAYPGF